MKSTDPTPIIKTHSMSRTGTRPSAVTLVTETDPEPSCKALAFDRQPDISYWTSACIFINDHRTRVERLTNVGSLPQDFSPCLTTEFLRREHITKREAENQFASAEFALYDLSCLSHALSVKVMRHDSAKETTFEILHALRLQWAAHQPASSR